MSSYKVLIITPIFYGSGTGAATYYRLLTSSLQTRGIDFVIVSERTKECVDIEYFGVLPTRTGKNKQFILDILIYGLQNLAYLRLPSIIQKSKPDVVLVHSSFYNMPGIFAWVMKWVIAQNHVSRRYIADVRDVLIPDNRIHFLNHYDKVISCSKNILNLLIKYGLPRQRIQYIRVPQEKLCIDLKQRELLLRKLRLAGATYIFYAGMIKELKAVDLLLESFVKFIHPICPDVVLVLAGYIKTTNTHIIKMLESPNIYYVGNLSRDDIIHLTSGASLCVNLSPNESISRFSLEALALQRPVLLPPNIPEYIDACPECVVTSRDPEEIAQQMMDVLKRGKGPSYPIERHFPDQVISEYTKVFESIKSLGSK